MARLESKAIMGYLPIEERHYAAILSLIMPSTPATRMLDPFAGEGAFLEAAAKAWQVTPYANELDAARAEKCIERFGPTQAVRCDVERLVASNEAFGILWANPPYDHDRIATTNSKRIEFAFLRHAWKWVQVGGIVMWVVYNQHITEEAAAFLGKHSRSVDIWALPGKHQGEYDQVVVVAIKGIPQSVEQLTAHVLVSKAAPRLLTVQPEPCYHAPVPDTAKRFVFSADMVDAEQGALLLGSRGAWLTHGFQSLLAVPQQSEQMIPIVPPRPGHMALLLAAGVANGAILETEEHGTVAVRGKTIRVEQIARTEVESLPEDPSREFTKTTVRLKPTTTITLISHDGTRVEMEGDAAILDFISRNKEALVSYLNRRFKPMYDFDLNGLGAWLDRIRLKGKYTLYTAQKHVIGAITRGFQGRKGILLVGQMGVGKTALGGSAAIALTSGLVHELRKEISADQVILIVTPPHLIDKWQRELYGVSQNIYVERLDRHEDVKGFMDKAARMGGRIPKIGLIKRDMTKLGSSREVSVDWRRTYEVRWPHNEPVPQGWEAKDRLVPWRMPTCPHCGNMIYQEKKGVVEPATETWLASGKRNCPTCNTPLWREAREGKQVSKTGTGLQDAKNPRYRLDEYLKRRYAGRVYLLIWDEVHEAAHGDTGNGEAFGRMAGVARKMLAMTGTPFNGRASSLFNLEYALNPRARVRYPWGGAPRLDKKGRGSKQFQGVLIESNTQRGRAESRWVADMGVQEKILEERPTYDRATGTYTGTSTYERPYAEAPGISPLLVAELLDHAIFFSLADLGKWLPQYEEIALAVDMDTDTLTQYKNTRQELINYLVACRWQGDTTFRGAYLQWAMGWPNATFRPYDIVHNRKELVSGRKLPTIVKRLPANGEDRVYNKEQALIDLVRQELGAGRAVVIFLRQTATRDIQPRIAGLLNRHIAEAKTFILKNTVSAERRERVIESEVAKGTNIVLCNPELVKTGLDLIFAPTLIFYEITFNLGTMMQAGGRSLRLNQTHTLCKTYYLFYRETMEHTAVELMSRKQRAAKLLNGDIGLTGLDALTEGEGSFEEALLNTIGRDEAFVDPAALFRTEATEREVLAEDAAYWNKEKEELKVDEATKSTATVQQEPSVATEVAKQSAPDLLGLLAGKNVNGKRQMETETPVMVKSAASDTSTTLPFQSLPEISATHDQSTAAAQVPMTKANGKLPVHQPTVAPASKQISTTAKTATKRRRKARNLGAPKRTVSPLDILAGRVAPMQPADGTLSTAPTHVEQLTLF